VLKGQCLRSNGGLYYESYPEFAATLRAIEQHRWLAGTLGRNGRQFFRDHYDWPVIERKYLEMFTRLSSETPTRTVDPLPGWFSRQRRNLPAAEQVLARLPTGPAVAGQPSGQSGDSQHAQRSQHSQHSQHSPQGRRRA
jgi:hypothetical protein